MSVLRAILGRFARFLVRIARTLDPGIAATPYWAVPERMAALRLRYPGATEPWLELIAQRTSLGDRRPPAPAVRAEPEAHENDQRPQIKPSDAARGRPRLRIGASRPAPRPQPRFPGPAPKAAVTTRLALAPAEARPDPDIPPAAARAVRPVLSFGSIRVRNPIANLLRGGAPKERPAAHLVAGEPLRTADTDRSAHLSEPDDVRREDWTTFRQPDPAPRHDSDWVEQRERAVGRQPIDPGWPEFRYSVPPGPSWPSASARTARHNPRFAVPDNRWPEIPPLIDESGAPGLRASDEAALLAEQMGGTWSA